MKIAIFDTLPFDLEAKKSLSPEGTTIMGSGVFGTAMAKALFRYGSWDAYWFAGKNRSREHFLDGSPEFAEAQDRARVVSFLDLAEARDSDVVLVTTGSALANLVPLRVAIGRADPPMCGFIHSLHGRAFAKLPVSDAAGRPASVACLSMQLSCR
jgi:hypothetical protein